LTISSKQKSFSEWVEKLPVAGRYSFSGEGEDEEQEVPDSSLDELLIAGFVFFGGDFISADFSCFEF